MPRALFTIESKTGLAVIATLIFVLYGRTVGFGLVWDDVVALRARPAAEIAAAWTGPWVSAGVWPDFYRPLAIALYAAAFRLLGHNTVALHAANLTALLAGAWMLLAFVRRETESAPLALVAAALLVMHPETPSSLAAWISQQFHLAALLCTLSGALIWQRVRRRGTIAWMLVLVPLTIGVLVKEDVLMVAPTLLAWQWIRRRMVGDVPAPTIVVLSLVAVWMAAYGVVRTLALGGLGGYDTPTLSRLALNVVAGPLFTFAMQWTPSAHGLSAAIGVGLVLLAVFAWRGRHDASPGVIVL